MRFEHPQALWLLTLSAPLVALYLVKRRAQKSLIASLFLWERAVSAMKVKQARQWPAEVLSLVLNLVILTCAALSLADPVFAGSADIERDVFLVLDTSASMHAVSQETGRTRLAEAVDSLRSVLASAGHHDRYALVEGGDVPRVLAELGSSREQINMMLDDILARPPLSTRGCLGETVDFILRGRSARALSASGGRERELFIVLASDGQEDFVPPTCPFGVRLFEYGPRTGSDNAGIVFASARRVDEKFVSVLVRFANHSAAPRELTLDVHFVPEDGSDGSGETPKQVKTLSFLAPPDGVSESVFEVECPSKGRLLLSLLPPDVLMLDNGAELFVGEFTRIRVVLATPARNDSSSASGSDEKFLWAALDAMGDMIDRGASVRLDLDMLGQMPDAKNDSLWERTVIVCAGQGSGEKLILPEGPSTIPVISFGISSGAVFSSEGAVGNLVRLPPRRPIAWNEGHPVMRGIEPDDISVTETFVRKVRENEIALAKTADGVIALAGISESGRYVWFGFPLSRTNLAILPAFPLLLKNSVEWLCADNRRNSISTYEFPVEESNLLQDRSSMTQSPAIPAPRQVSFVMRRGVLSVALAVVAAVAALTEWAFFCRWRKVNIQLS